MSTKIGGLQTAASDAQGFEDALAAAEDARDDYLAAEDFGSSDAIGDEATRLEGVRLEAVDLETAVTTAEGNRDAFFADGNPGAGFADSAAIGVEAVRVEGLGSVSYTHLTLHHRQPQPS